MKYFGRFSPTPKQPALARYAFAIASSVIAAVLTGSVSALQGIPFALSFVAIASTAWFAGFRAGIVSTGLSLVLVNWLVLPPRFEFAVAPQHLIQTAVLGAVAIFICAIARQREQKEARLHQVENYFEITLRSIGDAVIATDAHGAVTFLNASAESLTEWSLQEAFGKQLDEVMPLVNEQTGASIENPVQKVIAHGKVVGLANHTCLTTRSGRQVPIADSAAPIQDESGVLKGVVLVFRDMTREKEQEQQRMSAQERMRVAERLATAGRIAATVSHEINNPLAAVGNLIYLAKTSPDSSQASAYLAEAERQLFRAANIAKQTLTFYKQSGESVEVVVSEILKDAVALFASRIEQTKVRVRLDVQNEAKVLISPGELSQVVVNLLSNALDASPTLSEVSVRLEREDTMAVISVTDQGSGVSAEHGHRIFEPFFTTKNEMGTGLGLWVSKNIVEKCGGRLDYINLDGHGGGTRFTVKLPICK